MGAWQPPGVGAAVEGVRKSMEMVAQLGELLRSNCQIEELEIVSKVSESLTAVCTLLCGEAVKDLGGESAGSQCSQSMGGDSGGRRRWKGGKAVAATATSAKKGGGRKRSQPYSRRISTTVGDGYTWRKYGQKEIQSSKFPKSYFRCSYKYSRKCSAVKQVQRSEEDPSAYIITYIGQHTCQISPGPAVAEMEPPPETGDASPPPQSSITTVGEPKLECCAEAADCADCPDTEDLNWSELDLQATETAKNSTLSSSSIYGSADMETWSPFDTNSFFNF